MGKRMAKTVSIPLLSIDDPYADFFAAACHNQWTDGLPVIPPTPERIEEGVRRLAAVLQPVGAR